MTNKELIPLVLDEASKLRQKALKRELKALDFSRLQPKKIYACIYGQLTGDCYSERAVKLIEASCAKVIKRKPSKTWEAPIDGKLNGSPKKEDRDTYWSPIEVFIAKPINQKNGNNELLVNYLKDPKPRASKPKFKG